MATIPGTNRKAGESHHRARYSNDTVELARSLADEGLTFWQVAKKLEINPITVRDWIEYKTRVYG